MRLMILVKGDLELRFGAAPSWRIILVRMVITFAIVAPGGACGGEVFQPNRVGVTDAEAILQRILKKESGQKTAAKIFNELTNEMSGNTERYFYCDRSGWMDGRHFFASALLTRRYGRFGAVIIMFLVECKQFLWGEASAFSYEDLPSNWAGARLGARVFRSHRSASSVFREWMNRSGWRTTDDPRTPLNELPLQPGGKRRKGR